ncbi:hypothetical protein [Microcystis phage Mvi-JY20]|uniref:Uncharacterized protein n=1 Tax=Microcystis phage Mvi-JY20 TaxID=3128146 RepID=A0AAX4QH01_9CAUD
MDTVFRIAIGTCAVIVIYALAVADDRLAVQALLAAFLTIIASVFFSPTP